MSSPIKKILVTLLSFAAIAVVTACDSPHSEERETSDAADEAPVVAQTAPIEAAERATELSGIATIVSPETLLQIDADIEAAKISAKFSIGTMERFKSTKSLSQQTIEAAIKQASTDIAQQKLLDLRMKQTWGESAPFLEESQRKALISDFIEGKRAIVRMDFPGLVGGKPKNVRITPLSGGAASEVSDLWVAPSGSLAMPGVSYFGLVTSGPGLRAGDRARLAADTPDTHKGLIIPSSALVVAEGQTWCYIETAPEKYEKRPVPLELPYKDGYLVTAGFKAGEKIVVRGASLLLAREAEPGGFDDDDDGPATPRPKKQPASKPQSDNDDAAPDKTGASSDDKTTRVFEPAATASKDGEASLAQRARTKTSSDIDPD